MSEFDYGAPVNADVLARKGLDIKEMVDPETCVVSVQWCAQQMRQDFTDHDYTWDYGDE